MELARAYLRRVTPAADQQNRATMSTMRSLSSTEDSCILPEQSQCLLTILCTVPEALSEVQGVEL